VRGLPHSGRAQHDPRQRREYAQDKQSAQHRFTLQQLD
jgi:hypothetical protein